MQAENLSFANFPSAISEILARVTKIETLIEATKPEATTSAPDPEPFIYGIIGLAKFLKTSVPTAQKIKNSGKIPYSQAERTIIFRKADVLEALSNTKKRR
jgi:hypothetical protein